LADAQGEVKGIFSQHFFNRAPESLGQSCQRRYLPFQEKESYGWLAAFEELQTAFASGNHQQVLLIADREADIHQLLQAGQHSHLHSLIRRSHNPCLQDETPLWQALEEQSPAFCYSSEVEGVDGKRRTARLQVRYQALQLPAGYRPKEQPALQKVELWAIQAREISPPPAEKPLCWNLLTDLAIEQAAMAERLLRFYSYRWRIERFHYVLKQGCQVEKLQLQTPEALQKAIQLYSWIAYKVLQTQHCLQIQPQAALQQIGLQVQDYQQLGQVVRATKKKNLCLVSQPKVADFAELIARLGGSMRWKNQPLGVVCLWRGWKDCLLLKQAWAVWNTYG
jgi:hypothetical protein